MGWGTLASVLDVRAVSVQEICLCLHRWPWPGHGRSHKGFLQPSPAIQGPFPIQAPVCRGRQARCLLKAGQRVYSKAVLHAGSCLSPAKPSGQ